MAKEKAKAVEGSVKNPEVKQKKPVKKETELDKFKVEHGADPDTLILGHTDYNKTWLAFQKLANL